MVYALIAIAVIGCKEDDDHIVVDERFYVQFELGDSTILFENGIDDYGNGPGIRTYEDSIGRLYSQYTTFVRSALVPDFMRKSLTIQSVKFLTDTVLPPYSTSYDLFSEGSYDFGSYSLDSSTAGVDGMVIYYIDSDSTIWTSDLRQGSQESWADFAITSHLASGENQFGAKTKGTFNCRVYNQVGDHLDLRNGSFHARTIYPQTE